MMVLLRNVMLVHERLADWSACPISIQRCRSWSGSRSFRQALQGAHLVIGSILASSDEGEQGRLQWDGDADLGFPVPALRSEDQR